MKLNHIHTALVLLANAYLEICCYDMERSELRRHWIIRRTVDHNSIVWC